MNFKKDRGKLSILTAFIFSLGLVACVNNEGANPPPTGRNSRNQTSQNQSWQNQTAGGQIGPYNANRNGRLGASLNPNGTLNGRLDDYNVDNSQMGINEAKLRGRNMTLNNNIGRNGYYGYPHISAGEDTGIGNMNGNNLTGNINDRNNTIGSRMQGNLANPNNNNNIARADNIERAVKGVRGVRDCTVIIAGNRALVGVDMGATSGGKMTTQLKNNVEKAVRNTDRELETVAVTADPDLFTRITNVGEGIGFGIPFSQFGNEIEEIFRRIMPQ